MTSLSRLNARLALAAGAAMATASPAAGQGAVAAGPQPVGTRMMVVLDTLRFVALRGQEVDRIRSQLDSLIRIIDSAPRSDHRDRLSIEYDRLSRVALMAMSAARPASIAGEPATLIMIGPGLTLSGEIAAAVRRDEIEARLLAEAALPKGWLGFKTKGLTAVELRSDGQYVRYFDYPAITMVEANSPADSAGITMGDRLIQYDGIDVRDQWVSVTRTLEPSKRIVVRVRRDGDAKDYTLTVAPAPEEISRQRIEEITKTIADAASQPMLSAGARPAVIRGVPPAPAGGGGVGGGGGVFTGGRMSVTASAGPAPASAFIWGLSLFTVTPDLGKPFGASSGVLVLAAPDSTGQGVRAGLRVSDVIIRVGGADVRNVLDLRRQIASRVGDKLLLDVLRERKTVQLEMTPR